MQRKAEEATLKMIVTVSWNVWDLKIPTFFTNKVKVKIQPAKH